ncbi:HCL485Cp [Eremothecium sinecaudum]|uniref:HCL485Cp n=1 Tax=Eremothecium sinecaudum TaxID=45286 RepID=A0A120K1S9_9SACH|nr:HCL485Cp [Eremothecium sinecaudum]AMD19666.1 HCL485Cp [Eremothecium sinecaudum]
MSNENEFVEVIVKLPGGKDNKLVLSVSKLGKVQQIIDYLAFHKTKKYYTNYSLLYNQKKLDSDEIISDLVGNGTTLHVQMQFKLYTAKDVLQHFLSFREYVGLVCETYDGISEFALSTPAKFSGAPFMEIKNLPAKSAEENERQTMRVSEEEKYRFFDLVNQALESRSAVPGILKSGGNIIIPCLRSLIISGYNPVPAFFRTKGHLMYFQIVTLEGETFHVTATPGGFFVNNSTSSRFDPTPRNEAVTKQTLYEVCSHQSTKFVQHVSKLENAYKENDSTAYARPVTTFLHKPWMVSALPPNNVDFTQLQYTALDFHTDRNFNDEYQTVRESLSSDVTTLLEEEKLLSRVIHEFNVAATKGAMDIFYDNLVALNPDSPRMEHVYLKNSIFYSFISDFDGRHADAGGDEAAHASANQDLQAVKVLLHSNVKKACHLLTAIIEFGGVRVLAQSPVPGILDSNGVERIKDENGEYVTREVPNEVRVRYGQDETTGKIMYDEEIANNLYEFQRVFHLKTHTVGEQSKLQTSCKSKGIIGSDKRCYILDLVNNPLDVEFVRENYDGETDEEARYPHRQTLIRHELVERWWITKVENDKIELSDAFRDNVHAFNPDAYQMEGIEDKTVDDISNFLRLKAIPELVKKFADGTVSVPYTGEHLVDILHNSGINLRYLGKIINLAEKELEEQKSARSAAQSKIAEGNKEHAEWESNYLKKIEGMILERQAKIQQLLKENKEIPPELSGELALDENEVRKPHDGDAVVVNNDNLLTLIELSKLEIISRSVKHVIRKYSKELPAIMVSSLISYVLNLLFGSSYNSKPPVEIPDEVYASFSFEFTKLNQQSLLQEIASQAQRRFGVALSSDWLSQYGESPFMLLRSVCSKNGIQLLNKEYFFTKEQYESWKQSQDKKVRNKLVDPVATFCIQDFSLRPIVKVADMNTNVGDRYWAQASELLKQDDNQQHALVLFTQAIAAREEIYGVVHPIVAESYYALSNVYSNLGAFVQAIALCRKACAIYERVAGYDSFQLMRCLNGLAYLELSNESPFNAALSLSMLLEIFSCNCPSIHPSVISAYYTLGTITGSMKNVPQNIQVLNKISELILKVDGEMTYPYALNESRIGNLYASIEDFENSLPYIQNSFDLFCKELGLNHQTTAQCKRWISGIENIITEKEQQKKLAAASNTVTGSNPKPKKSNTNSVNPNPELVSKSIDELVNFINGDGSSKSSKTQNKNKKNSSKKKALSKKSI